MSTGQTDPAMRRPFYFTGVGTKLAPSQVIREARELDLSKAYGRGVGLSDEATAEVIDTWLAWYRRTPMRVSWTAIRDMLAKRASGGDWWPRGSV